MADWLSADLFYNSQPPQKGTSNPRTAVSTVVWLLLLFLFSLYSFIISFYLDFLFSLVLIFNTIAKVPQNLNFLFYSLYFSFVKNS